SLATRGSSSFGVGAGRLDRSGSTEYMAGPGSPPETGRGWLSPAGSGPTRLDSVAAQAGDTATHRASNQGRNAIKPQSFRFTAVLLQLPMPGRASRSSSGHPLSYEARARRAPALLPVQLVDVLGDRPLPLDLVGLALFLLGL